MGYINKNDTLILDGRTPVIALGSEFTELYYDAEAREMARHGIDYGVARGVVRVLVPSSAQEITVELNRIRKLEQ